MLLESAVFDGMSNMANPVPRHTNTGGRGSLIKAINRYGTGPSTKRVSKHAGGHQPKKNRNLRGRPAEIVAKRTEKAIQEVTRSVISNLDKDSGGMLSTYVGAIMDSVDPKVHDSLSRLFPGIISADATDIEPVNLESRVPPKDDTPRRNRLED